MTGKPRAIPRLYLQVATTVDEGRHLELIGADASGSVVEDGLYPIAMVVADDSGELWMELYLKSESVRIPMSEVERAIEVAKRNVRSERSFERELDELFGEDT